MLQERMTLPVGAPVRGSQGEVYLVEAVLGHGGFSAVYKVRSKKTKEQVFALKEIINPDAEARSSLTREAALLKRLEYPSLPRVYQVFENVKLDRIYLLMDYIEGDTLSTLRRDQPDQHFSPEMVRALMSPIIGAVSYLHTQQPPIVHRDIKPSNIILPASAEAILVDFGLAKEYVEEKTTNVLRFGTPGYAAPEQYAGGTNPQTDIYGLAATIYMLLTAEKPEDALQRMMNQRDEDPLKRADMVSDRVPPAVGRVLEHAMSLKVDNRYATVEEFWEAFTGAVKDPEAAILEPVKSETDTSLPLEDTETKILSRPKRRSYALAIWLIVIPLLLLLGALGSYLFWPANRQTSNPAVVNRPVVPTIPTPPNACTPASSGPNISVFPLLNPCYAGTIDDIGVAQRKTNMYLIEIKQNQDQISGRFQGLNLNGTFKGTIKQNGDMQFVVSLNGRKDTLIFTGNSKYGGDMRGNFELRDQNGRPAMDEYGNWYTGPYTG